MVVVGGTVVDVVVVGGTVVVVVVVVEGTVVVVDVLVVVVLKEGGAVVVVVAGGAVVVETGRVTVVVGAGAVVVDTVTGPRVRVAPEGSGAGVRARRAEKLGRAPGALLGRGASLTVGSPRGAVVVVVGLVCPFAGGSIVVDGEEATAGLPDSSWKWTQSGTPKRMVDSRRARPRPISLGPRSDTL